MRSPRFIDWVTLGFLSISAWAGSGSHGGDPIQFIFDEARRSAPDILGGLPPENVTEIEARAFFTKHKQNLISEIATAQLEWVDGQLPGCARTDLCRGAKIHLSVPTCTKAVSNATMALKVLTHEAIHHFGLADEDQVTRIANALVSSALARRDQCTDFSGLWKGTCEFDKGTKFDSTLYIERWGCDELKVNYAGGKTDMDRIFIGSTYKTSFDGARPAIAGEKWRTNNDVQRADWNDLRTRLTVNSGSWIHTDEFTMTSTDATEFAIVGQELIVQTKFTNIYAPTSGTSNTDTGSRVCIHRKQP